MEGAAEDAPRRSLPAEETAWELRDALGCVSRFGQPLQRAAAQAPAPPPLPPREGVGRFLSACAYLLSVSEADLEATGFFSPATADGGGGGGRPGEDRRAPAAAPATAVVVQHGVASEGAAAAAVGTAATSPTRRGAKRRRASLLGSSGHDGGQGEEAAAVSAGVSDLSGSGSDGPAEGHRRSRPRHNSKCCPICGSPSSMNRRGNQPCRCCYTGLYNDAHKVSQAYLRRGEVFAVTQDVEGDLVNFASQLRAVVKPCPNGFSCPPSCFSHNVPVRKRCQRCRTLATLDIAPQFSHNLLKTVIRSARNQEGVQSVAPPDRSPEAGTVEVNLPPRRSSGALPSTNLRVVVEPSSPAQHPASGSSSAAAAAAAIASAVAAAGQAVPTPMLTVRQAVAEAKPTVHMMAPRPQSKPGTIIPSSGGHPLMGQHPLMMMPAWGLPASLPMQMGARMPTNPWMDAQQSYFLAAAAAAAAGSRGQQFPPLGFGGVAPLRPPDSQGKQPPP